jgi:Fe-S cluster assembly protein SufD
MLKEALSPTDQAFAVLFDTRKDDGARDLRMRAWADYARAGLPTRRNESWHYTDLRAALRQWSESAPPTPPEDLPHAEARVELYGEFDWRAQRPPSETYAPPPGVSCMSLRLALASADAATLEALAPKIDDPVFALNGALMADGAVISIAPGATIDAPIVIGRHRLGEGLSTTRSLIVVGAGARVTILEHAAQSEIAGGFDNDAMIIALGKGAVVNHCFLATSRHAASTGVATLVATLGDDASFASCALIEGGGLLRRQVFARLVGENANASFDGVTLLRGADFVDTTLNVEHAKPRGKSRETFRTIVDGAATGVFQGKITVQHGAQKTDGAMQSKALLLSDGATMNNKPELEIFADDVVCGHGATCGRLDKDQLFYLAARGLPKEEAEALLIEGFAKEALVNLENDSLRSMLEERISAWLVARRAVS